MDADRAAFMFPLLPGPPDTPVNLAYPVSGNGRQKLAGSMKGLESELS
jgi:hypothetical protein